MFKEYGIRLNFIPTITPRGTIRLQVAPEVSSLDFTNAVEISGFEVPAITTRKVKTEVELATVRALSSADCSTTTKRKPSRRFRSWATFRSSASSSSRCRGPRPIPS